MFSVFCRADVQISSDFYFSLNAESYTKILLNEKWTGEENQKIENWKINGDYQSIVENILLKIKYDLEVKPDDKNPTRFLYDLSFPNGRIEISSIKTNAVIYKNVGGVQATIYLKGECRNIVIETSGPLEASGQIQVAKTGKSLGAFVQSIDYKNQQNWQMNVGDCEGPQGYQQALEKELRSLLNDKTRMSQILMQPFQNQLNQRLASMNESLFSPKQIPVQEEIALTLLPLEVELDEVTGQVLLKGIVKTQFASQEEKHVHVDAPLFAEDVAVAPRSGLMVSQKYLQTLIRQVHESRLLYKKYFAQQIPGLDQLFRSRFFQFFLWPDLMNFRRNAPFSFEVSASQSPQLDFDKIYRGVAWFDLHSHLKVQTRTPQNQDYGQFLSPLKAQPWLRVYNNQLALGFYQPKMKLKFIWDQVYLAIQKPFQTLSAAFFGQKIQSTIKDYRWTTDLPLLKLEDRVLMTPKQLAGNKDWLVLEYAP